MSIDKKVGVGGGFGDGLLLFVDPTGPIISYVSKGRFRTLGGMAFEHENLSPAGKITRFVVGAFAYQGWAVQLAHYLVDSERIDSFQVTYSYSIPVLSVLLGMQVASAGCNVVGNLYRYAKKSSA